MGPVFIFFVFIGTGAIFSGVAGLLCFFRSSRSHSGFKLLSQPDKRYFDESDEEDLEMDRTLDKMGINSHTAIEYHDASSSSDEEDFLINRPSAKNNVA